MQWARSSPYSQRPTPRTRRYARSQLLAGSACSRTARFFRLFIYRRLSPFYSQVKLLDRKLGILYSLCILLVVGYVVGVRVILEKGYNAHEKSYGVVGARLNGTTFSIRGGSSVPPGSYVPYDVPSLIQIEEGNALFIPTRIIRTPEQRLGNCSNPDEPCTRDSDCPVSPPLSDGMCNAGFCTRLSWCNAGGTAGQPVDPFSGNAAISASQEIMCTRATCPNPPGLWGHEASLGNLSLVLMSSIRFDRLGQTLLSTEDEERRAKRVWNLTSVLARAMLTEADVVQTGAVLAVTLKWECHNLYEEDDCVPHLLVTSLSRGQPFMKSWAS